MKAIGYQKAHALDAFALTEIEIDRPPLGDSDVLIQVHAVGINPVDFKYRKTRTIPSGDWSILGWDAAGVIVEKGTQVPGFEIGDEVYYSGEITRLGANSEFHAVDHRIIAKKPKNLTFAEAAALPLTSLTAWEALFEKGLPFGSRTRVLIIGGAGGVGSIAIQLLKAKTQATVIATASRPASAEWCKKMGADAVISASGDLSLKSQLKALGYDSVDLILGTTHTEKHLESIPEILRPFGHFVLIDDPQTLDISSFKKKSQSVHWEYMFAKSIFRYEMNSQGKILEQVGQLVNEGKIKTTLKTKWNGLTPANLRLAHAWIESGQAIGKAVLTWIED